jgi:hypothetical protein
MFLQNGGGLCAHRAGGASTIRIVCASHNPLIEFPLSAVEGTEFRVTTKRGYESASVAVRAEKRAIKSDKLIVLFSETETAKQNQKFPFHFFFRFAVEGWGGETRGKCKEIFWFLHTRVRERVRGALVRITAQSERTRQFQATTRSARAISSSHQDFARNAFELCPIHTADLIKKKAK